MKLVTGEEVRTGRTFFDRKEHMGDAGLLVHPLRVTDVPDRDGNAQKVVVCDVWAFRSIAQVQSGTPEKLSEVYIAGTYVVNAFEPEIGNLLGPLVIQQITKKSGTGWYWGVTWASSGSTGYAEMKDFALRLVEEAAQSAPPAPPAPSAPAAPAAQPMFEQAYAAPPAPPAAGGYAPPPPAPMSGSVPPPPPPAA